ncbi:MAG: hypothetical protein JJU28_24495 [Cyclobacteriaceae bacterium]|nr:hypothetical protein [Cyclobacteriaceae bacterium]
MKDIFNMNDHNALKIEVLYGFMIELFRFPSLKLTDAAVTYQNMPEENHQSKGRQFDLFIQFLFDSPPTSIEEKYFSSPHVQNVTQFMLLATEHEIRSSILNQQINNLCNPFCFNSFHAYLLYKQDCIQRHDAYFLRDFIIPVLYQIKDSFVSELRPLRNIRTTSKHLQRYEQHFTNPFQHAFLALLESFVNLTRPQAPFSEIPEAFSINPLAISKRNDRAFFPGWICKN